MKIVAKFGLVLMLLVGSAMATDASLPAEPNETLVFKLSWGMFTVGQVLFKEYDADWEGQAATHYLMEARTNGFADKIYKVRDRVDSYVLPDQSRSLHYTQVQNEGSHTRDITVTFDHENAKAQYTNEGDSRPEIDIELDTLDPLAVLYALRSAGMTVGEELTREVTDGKRARTGLVKVVKRETRTFGGKSYETIVVEPDLKDLGGVFKKSKKASLQIWFTDDERCVPLRIQSKVAVGSFVAELVSVEPSL